VKRCDESAKSRASRLPLRYRSKETAIYCGMACMIHLRASSALARIFRMPTNSQLSSFGLLAFAALLAGYLVRSRSWMPIMFPITSVQAHVRGASEFSSPSIQGYMTKHMSHRRGEAGESMMSEVTIVYHGCLKTWAGDDRQATICSQVGLSWACQTTGSQGLEYYRYCRKQNPSANSISDGS
jgi:hypothetical protein